VPRFCLRLLLCVYLTWGSPVLALAGGDIAIITSDRSAAYLEATEAIYKDLERGGIPRSSVSLLGVNELDAGRLVQQSNLRIVITLGSSALRAVSVTPIGAPVLAALVPRGTFEEVVHDRDTKVLRPLSVLYLDQPVNRQLELIRLALPDAHALGVLWGPESGKLRAAYVSAAERHHIALVSGTVGALNSLYAGLKAAMDGADVILAIADPLVYNANTISNILLASYRAKIPLVGFSPAYTSAGALLSLYSTPEQLGNQVGMMARSLLSGAETPMVQYPLYFSLSVNERVARSLSLSLDAEALTEKLRRLESAP